MTDLISKAAAIQAVFDWEQGKISGTLADAIAALPATDARERALREAAAVANALADRSVCDADLWLKDGMPKTAAIAREHAQAARAVASAILALIGEART